MTTEHVSFTVNDTERAVEVSGSETLLDTLRDQLGLRGSKEGCLEGECGACTVLLDGRPIDSCIYPTAACAGRQVRTVEGVAKFDAPSLLQQAMVRSARDLAALLAAETGAGPDDLRPQVVANALLGLQRAMIDYVRGRVGSGGDLGGLAADVRKLTAEAFALLEHGLAGYPARP